VRRLVLYDVVIDMRPESLPPVSHWRGLTAENRRALYVPRCLPTAIRLTDEAEVVYQIVSSTCLGTSVGYI